MSKAALLELADRVEKASGPDRELDLAIHRLAFPDDTGSAPAYTREFIAAMTILPELTAAGLAAVALRARAGQEPSDAR